jgi:antitoxin component of MazEF toxin-antitoxin module
MMEAIIKAKRFGGSIGIILPKNIIDKERISPEDNLKIKIEKTSDLNFLWGKLNSIKKSTDQIMAEIDEGEIDE